MNTFDFEQVFISRDDYYDILFPFIKFHDQTACERHLFILCSIFSISSGYTPLLPGCYFGNIYRWLYKIILTHIFPMFSFNPPGNFGKTFVSWCFQEDQKEILGRTIKLKLTLRNFYMIPRASTQTLLSPQLSEAPATEVCLKKSYSWVMELNIFLSIKAMKLIFVLMWRY